MSDHPGRNPAHMRTNGSFQNSSNRTRSPSSGGLFREYCSESKITGTSIFEVLTQRPVGLASGRFALRATPAPVDGNRRHLVFLVGSRTSECLDHRS